jgi:hypothetical protein
MKYVYLNNGVVADQAQVNPLSIFKPSYASQFIEAPDEVTFGWRLNNGDWVAPEPPKLPSPEQIQALAATEYQRQRAAEYPPMADYIDGIVKGDQAQVQAYIDACLAVKAKYPKP